MSRPIEVEGPDGTIFEFPAGTAPDVMRNALRRRFPADAQPAEAPAAPPAPPVAQQPRPAPVGFGEGFGMGVMDPIHGAAQLVANAVPSGVADAVNSGAAWLNRNVPITRSLGMTPATAGDINQNVRAREADYTGRRDAAGQDGVDWGRGMGQVVPAAVLALATRSPQSIVGSVGIGATQGGVMGAAQPVAGNGDYWDQVKQQTETGLWMGGLTGPLGYLAGRLMAPRIDPNVRQMADAGVQMTPGQIAGGAVRRVEDAVTSIPGVGDMVRNAQRRGIENFNTATANRALSPLGVTVPPNIQPGRELAEFVAARASQAYDEALPQVRPFGPDQQFAQDLARIGRGFLTPQSQQDYAKFLRDNVISRIQGGPIDGQTYQTVKSEALSRVASEYGGSSTAAEREIGRALREVQRAMQDLLERQNPQVAPLLSAADSAYAGAARMLEAAARPGAVDGVFTPAQLAYAVRHGDPSLRHRAYAQGNALMQDFSDPARAVLPSTVPDSGSAGRIATMGLAGALANGAGFVTMPQLLAAGAVAGAYTRPGNEALARLLLAQRPGAVRMAGDALAASGGGVSVPLASMLLSPPPPNLERRP